jgi:hypothetical protein
LVSTIAAPTRSPRRTAGTASRCTPTRRGDPASRTSTTTAASTTPSQPKKVARPGTNASGSAPARASSTARPVITIVVRLAPVLRRSRSAGTGTAASTLSRTPSTRTPSSSASGRSWTRCRSVERASAFTSSGVT